MNLSIEERLVAIRAMDDGPEKVTELCRLSGRARLVDPSQSLALAEEAHALAGQMDQVSSRGEALVAMGSSLIELSQYHAAQQYLLQATDIFTAIGDIWSECLIRVDIGILYSEMGRQEEALAMFLESLDIAGRHQIVKAQAICHSNLATLYSRMPQGGASALVHAEEALRLSQESGDTYGCMHDALVLGNIWGTYRQDHRKAIEYFAQALALAEQHGYLPTGPLISMAVSYTELGEDELALSTVLRAEEHLVHGEQDTLVAYARSVRARLAARQGRYEQATAFLEQVLTSVDSTELQYRTHEELSDYYARLQQYDKALEHYREFHRIRTEAFSEESQRRFQALTVQYDVERTRAEKELAEKEREIARLNNEELSSALAEVRALNDRLVQLDHEKNEVLGVVAHDLKSPLAGVRMVSSLLKNHHDKMSKAELAAQLESVEQASERMLRIVSTLLDVHAIESGTVYSTVESVAISSVVQSVVQSYASEAQRKYIALHLQCEEHLTVQGSETLVQQVVDNLVSNALKFSPTGTEVAVVLRCSGSRIILEVRDQGPGISGRDRSRLFGKYGRLSARPTGGESSTGLGLWIVQKAVESLQGSIRHRRRRGGGSVFVVEIPAASTSTVSDRASAHNS